MKHSSSILLYLEVVSWSVAQIFLASCFVLFFISWCDVEGCFVFTTKEDVLLYYQQLNVPKFRTNPTWILWGSCFFLSSFVLGFLTIIFEAIISDFFSPKNWTRSWKAEENEKVVENRHFHQKQITEVILRAKAWRQTTAVLLWTRLCSRSAGSTFLAFTEKGKRKHFKHVFRMNIKPKPHKNVHSGLQPISESLRFPFCCSHTWGKPGCHGFPTPR